ncbi:hypothetical protein T484DRAFT_1817552, partial [Baffinella frigidus]
DDESHLLTLSSVFGSAKATQESDNVIILQNSGLIKYLDIRKNRYDGTLGFVPLNFDPKTLRFRQARFVPLNFDPKTLRFRQARASLLHMTPEELRDVEETQE